MLRILFIFLIVFSIDVVGFSQNSAHYWVGFTDKQNNTYSLLQPEQFLSQRALNRRTKQNIALDSTDLPVSKFYIDSLKSLGLQIKNASKWLNGVTVLTNDTNLMDTIDNLEFVLYHQKTKPLLYKKNKRNKKQKQRFNRSSVYGYGNEQITLLHGNYLHNQGFRGDSMLIAIIDAGFNDVSNMHLFDSLRNDNRIIATYDFVAGDTNVYDDHTHGMSVLSTMAVNKPGYFIGTAPKASFILLRSEDANTEYLVEEDTWTVAVEYADSAGADLINTSLGYTTFDDATQNHSYSDMNGMSTRIAIAADFAFKKGIFVTVSAGNSGDDSWHYISTPADAKDVLTVGAVDLSGNYALFSSTGPSADGRIKPNVASPGENVKVAFPNDTISGSNGTSFSAPITCGLVACLWEAFPDKTNYEIKSAIEQSASQYTTPDSLLGYGIPNFEKAYFFLSGIVINDMNEVDYVVYPNPLHDELNIDFFVPNIYTLQLSILNIVGEKIFFEDLSNSGIKASIKMNGLNKLESGVYIMKLNLNGVIHQKKLVKL